jgi:hypothetical protein
MKARDTGGFAEHTNPFMKRADNSQIYRTASTKNSYNSALYSKNMIPEKNSTFKKSPQKPAGPHPDKNPNQSASKGPNTMSHRYDTNPNSEYYCTKPKASTKDPLSAKNEVFLRGTYSGYGNYSNSLNINHTKYQYNNKIDNKPVNENIPTRDKKVYQSLEIPAKAAEKI